jgi:hypothetical protein
MERLLLPLFLYYHLPFPPFPSISLSCHHPSESLRTAEKKVVPMALTKAERAEKAEKAEAHRL